MSTVQTAITAQERAKRVQAVEFTLANLRLEGMYLDRDNLALYQQFTCGEISEEALYAALDALCEQKFGPLSVSRNSSTEESRWAARSEAAEGL